MVLKYAMATNSSLRCFCYILNRMGNSKSLYSKQDLLYYHIQRKDIPNVRTLLEKHPEIVNDPLVKDNKQTALMRIAFNGNLELLNLLISFNADPNAVTPKGETALSIAVKRDRLEIAQRLIEAGANINHTSPLGFRILDYAILGGFYELSRVIFSRLERKDKEALQDPEYYETNGKKYAYRYVNYTQFLEGLVLNKDYSQMPNFLRKQKKKLQDPVVDPRQTWKQWFKRQMEWKDAPLVERNSLPQNLQPQNRTLGKVHHYTNNWMSTHMAQKTHLHPVENRQCISQMADLNTKKNPTEQKFHETRSQV